MITVLPGVQRLGAKVINIDLSKPLDDQSFATLLNTLANHGVISFPGQKLEPAAQKAFAARFGTLEINIANSYQEPGHPEVMILSNILENGKPIGLADAGQDWHTDMSYSRDIAFANVLYGIKIPRRNGTPLGSTEFADMFAAYETLPEEVRRRLEGATATHDFNKFWEEMRRRPGSTRPPLSEEQRRQKPPVSHPVFLTHPISGRRALYANPGYTTRIDGWTEAESEKMLDFLFAHQLSEEFRYTHQWAEGDVLMWDNISTLHNAKPDYGPGEHRLIKRCQVKADRVFDPAFMRLVESARR
jgi:taurine dioxygenase